MGGWIYFVIKALTNIENNLIFGRSFKHRSSQRRPEDSERAERRDVEEEEEEEESSVLESLDSRAVATILRGLAEAADHWDEL